MNPFHAFGRWWLSGPKYRISQAVAGKAWDVPAIQALGEYDRRFPSPESVRTLPNVIALGHGFVWKPDPVFQAWDRVYPPEVMLARGGGDCDDWAMLHAQLIEAGLGGQGWQARIVSYVAHKWWLSHHFAVAIAPDGGIWPIQPRSRSGEPDVDPIWPYSFTTFDEAARAIAEAYGTEPAWFDVRDPWYRPLA